MAWPASFGQRYTIFVDTEEEFDWSAPFDRSNRAISASAALPPATRRFADLGAPLALLVDHPIATDPAAIANVRQALETAGTAIGTQLHPWVNPPFDEDVCATNSFAGNLPRDLEAAKLLVLTQAIADAFGERPRIYRAGRYGLGPNTMGLLAAQGYAIDSSMRSRYDYSSGGGPDYGAIGNAAFAIGDSGLVELPLTTVYTGALRSIGPALDRIAATVPRLTGALARGRMLGRVALTPEDMPLRDALEAVRIVVGDGLPLLNLSFHSPTLVPGHTPYVRSDADLSLFWHWWDGVIGLLDTLGVHSVGATELLAAIPCAHSPASVSTTGAVGL
ncbi:MAG: polysaccharide deacetylase family protein [Pseudomonadota bacterium]